MFAISASSSFLNSATVALRVSRQVSVAGFHQHCPLTRETDEEPSSYLSSIKILQIPEGKKLVVEERPWHLQKYGFTIFHCSHGFMLAFRHLCTGISSGLNSSELYLCNMHTSNASFIVFVCILSLGSFVSQLLTTEPTFNLQSTLSFWLGGNRKNHWVSK